MTKHYLFENLESGEEFIVGENNIEYAIDVAIDNFGDQVRFICTLTDDEAEASGLDEY